ncbi:hypothetical protein R75465_06126 [Paraburkholderia aspalathi]|uniref:DUF3280 domain-containing protein n=1 Tax=Paraburkholderia aspalathi TaxID=1324617 RepID=UPI001B26FBDE|nr:DUF3280 domain-containing protein [Paraburkholderia aspalathi]CAE6827701.1 hypothetical protein R75465_06126 [Paraburkholderia aspalathi]
MSGLVSAYAALVRHVRFTSMICVAFACSQALGAPTSIAVMDCVLIDDNAAYNDVEINRVQQARIEMVSNALREQLRNSRRYHVADNAPASGLIARLGVSQDLNACADCARQVGRKLGVEQVGRCWVQKVSNLILNINLHVEDVASGATVFQRTVDIRGNTDRSWRRGATALVGLIAGSSAAGSAGSGASR